MRIIKTYGDWIDIGVRESSNGTSYLLQMAIRNDGKKKFRNRRIDADGFPYLLFHGNQGITDKIMSNTNHEN